MSRKSKKSQSVAVETPVIVSDVAAEVAVAEVATETEVVAELPVTEAATEVQTEVVAEAPPAQKVKKYPREGGKCRQVWDACDELSSDRANYLTVKTVRDHAEMQGWNTSNASQEFYAWRKYHGIK